MADSYLSHDGEIVHAMRLDPELVTVLSVWCRGVIVKEIDPFDENKTFPAVNLETREGVSRASLGDYVVKHDDGTFEVKKPGAFRQNHIPND
jgi:hypothetical protein